MKIDSFSLSGYKAFADAHEIELRPITVVIGKNSSGKSALVRLPVLLANSLFADSEPPLHLQTDDIDFAGSFLDLINGRKPHGSVTVGFRIRPREDDLYWMEFEATIQNISDLGVQVISRYSVKDVNKQNIELVWNEDTDDLNSPSAKYICNFNGGEPDEVAVEFCGLVPISCEGSTNHVRDTLLHLAKASRVEKRAISYLGPFRETASRTYRYPGHMPSNVGGGLGENAAQVLGMDSKLKKGILGATSDWFEQNLGGWKLNVYGEGDQFSLGLSHASQLDESEKINLVDVGQGMGQVLPIIVNRFLSGQETAPSIEINEQPELHLHPAAHGSLADLYCSAIKTTKTKFLIETHSENLILRLRRRVADGTITPKDVIIYYVNDEEAPRKIMPIEILKNGDVSFWPQGVFSEDYAELKAIYSRKK